MASTGSARTVRGGGRGGWLPAFAGMTRLMGPLSSLPEAWVQVSRITGSRPLPGHAERLQAVDVAGAASRARARRQRKATTRMKPTKRNIAAIPMKNDMAELLGERCSDDVRIQRELVAA